MNSMLVIVLLIAVFCLILRGLSFSVFLGSTETETVDKTAAIGNGGTLSVVNRNGSIQIGSWDGEEVKIHAVKKSRYGEDELKKVDIQITPNGKDLEIKTVCSAWNCKVSVDYEILVPSHGCVGKVVTSNGSINIADVSGQVTAETSNGSIVGKELKGGINAETTNGSIKLNGVAGSAAAATTNGSIHIRDANTTSAETTNGNVEVEVKATPEQDIKFASTNGSVTVRVASGVNADVKMSTCNGRVSATDVKAIEATRTRLNGKLGNGGKQLRIETSNGNATLRRD
jgi:DUF4097 and DUF4098 domain-containing protein YvlB